MQPFPCLGFHLTPDLLAQIICQFFCDLLPEFVIAFFLLPEFVLAFFLVGFHLVQLLLERSQLVAVTLPQRFQLAHLPLLLCQ